MEGYLLLLEKMIWPLLHSKLLQQFVAHLSVAVLVLLVAVLQFSVVLSVAEPSFSLL